MVKDSLKRFMIFVANFLRQFKFMVHKDFLYLEVFNKCVFKVAELFKHQFGIFYSVLGTTGFLLLKLTLIF